LKFENNLLELRFIIFLGVEFELNRKKRCLKKNIKQNDEKSMVKVLLESETKYCKAIFKRFFVVG